MYTDIDKLIEDYNLIEDKDDLSRVNFVNNNFDFNFCFCRLRYRTAEIY